MKKLVIILIFLSSSSIWSTHLICDTFHIYSPDYEKRITFSFPPESTYIEIEIYKYYKGENKFISTTENVYIQPLKITSKNWQLDRQTGKMKHFDKSEPDRTCRKHDRASRNREGEKVYKFIEKQESKRKI